MALQGSKPVTLVTGSRKGIGKYLVEYYIEKGHYVIGCSRQDSDVNHEHYEHFILDVANEKSVSLMFAQIRKKHGRLDHAINNAGIASMNHVMLTPSTSAERILQTNVLGSFLICREAAKLMMKHKEGRIVNFSTVAVPLRLEGEALYAASKAAIVTLTEILAKELAQYGITVNAVGPTPIETDLIRNVPQEKLNKIFSLQSIQRIGTYPDVANVLDFFLKPESSFITGQTIYLGGVS